MKEGFRFRKKIQFIRRCLSSFNPHAASERTGHGRPGVMGMLGLFIKRPISSLGAKQQGQAVEVNHVRLLLERRRCLCERTSALPTWVLLPGVVACKACVPQCSAVGAHQWGSGSPRGRIAEEWSLLR